MAKENQVEGLTEIKNKIEAFCEKHLNAEYAGYALKLCDTVNREPGLAIDRGKKEVWAAAFIYAIARLNFLFDRENKYFLTTDTINDFFETNKSTVANKAYSIEKACGIGIGQEGYCREEISDMLTMVELPNGFIIPKQSLKKREIVFEEADEETSKEIEGYIEEKKRLQEQQKKEKQARLAEKKRMKRNKDQLSLFDEDL